jgi:hypothetical protein
MGILLLMLLFFFGFLIFLEHQKYMKWVSNYLSSLKKVYHQLSSEEKVILQNRALKSFLKSIGFLFLFILMSILISSFYYNWWQL